MNPWNGFLSIVSPAFPPRPDIAEFSPVSESISVMSLGERSSMKGLFLMVAPCRMMDSSECLPHHCLPCSWIQELKSDSGKGSVFRRTFGLPSDSSAWKYVIVLPLAEEYFRVSETSLPSSLPNDMLYCASFPSTSNTNDSSMGPSHPFMILGLASAARS